MKRLLILISLILFITLISCGHWRDNIQLSIKNVEFNAEGDSVMISTQGDWWWVTSISVNDTTFYDFSGIDVLSDNYRIVRDCFVVERRNKHLLFISLNANNSKLTRVVTVALEAGDYFDNVTITQKPSNNRRLSYIKNH